MGMKMIIQEQSVILVRTGGIWKFWHTVFWVDPLGLKTWIFTGYVLLCWVQSHLDLLDAKTWIFWLFLTDVHLFLTRTFPTMVVLRIMLGIQTYTNRYCMHEVTDFVFFFNWSFSASTISFAKLGEPQRDFLQGPWHVWFLPSIKEALPQGRLPAFEDSLKVDLVAHSSQSIRRCVAMSRLIMWILSIVR